jgi:hypothetical protein
MLNMTSCTVWSFSCVIDRHLWLGMLDLFPPYEWSKFLFSVNVDAMKGFCIPTSL